MAKKANGEGSIYKRSVDGMYVGSITLENGKRKYFYSKKRQEVRDKLNAALQEKQKGTLVTAPQQTLDQYLKDWLENTVKDTVRPRTYERYESIVRLHIAPMLGKVKLQALTPRHIQTLKSKKLKEGLSPTTVSAIQDMLHKALDDAIKMELLARNVCEAVSSPRKQHKEIQPLMPDEALFSLLLLECDVVNCSASNGKTLTLLMAHCRFVVPLVVFLHRWVKRVATFI